LRERFQTLGGPDDNGGLGAGSVGGRENTRNYEKSAEKVKKKKTHPAPCL
jgi:hypothetical protein